MSPYRHKIILITFRTLFVASPADDQERPLSAENLLPEPNIASMTSCADSGRLSSVLHGGPSTGMTSKALTRQQTFPPPQPYIRMRYLSATVEMSTCAETANEGNSYSFILEQLRILLLQVKVDQTPPEAHTKTYQTCRSTAYPQLRC